MNYPEVIDYLYKQLPMFHRIGAAAYKANLDNIHALTDHLNHPENKITTIHIAGTNGKGSVSNMLASILQEAGYKTGLFTSPHLKDFRERIRIDGKMIAEAEIVHFVEENKIVFEKISPSFFEWTTALAFEYFANEKTDVAIIETGLGGRLDSTNIITPVLSIITNISFDHMQFLGDTLEKIAYEKAGIIKKNIPVVVGEKQNECSKVFIDKAKEMNSELLFASENFSADFSKLNQTGQHLNVHKNQKEIFHDLLIELKGKYQIKNVCTVLQSIDLLKKHFAKIDNRSIVEGLRNISTNTGFAGRWQVINESPLTIVDAGHNESGIGFVVEQLQEMKFEKLHFVFGMVNDKDPSRVLKLLPKNAIYYFCKANLPRGLDSNELKKSASNFGLQGKSFENVSDAVRNAKMNAGKNDVIFIGGSTFVVAEVL